MVVECDWANWLSRLLNVASVATRGITLPVAQNGCSWGNILVDLGSICHWADWGLIDVDVGSQIASSTLAASISPGFRLDCTILFFFDLFARRG
jgi:hypothetical protein